MSTTNEKAAAELGLDVASDRKEAEYNLVNSLLKAVDYKTSDDSQAEVEIRRKGVYFFTVHICPIGDKELQEARRHATEYARNPQGPRYPKIEKSVNGGLLNSWLIYLATTQKDRDQIWGNKAVISKCGVMQPVETIDELLTMGEKTMLLETIFRISGLEDDEEAPTQEEYAKKS